MITEEKLQDLIRKTTPLTEASFYILVSLAEPLHGYGVMQKVMELSRSRVSLGPGTLYGALTNLVSQGLIEAVDGVGGDRKKMYRLTEEGRTIAEHEVHRMEELTRHGRMLLKI
jgi:DNA-binding PadR family transcriptional regulator